MSAENFNDNIERACEAPARLLEDGIEFVRREKKNIINKRPFRRAEEYWDTLGPGLTTGAVDDDPSGIVVYSQAGAKYGFQLVWLSVFSFPFMAIVQEMCARIGIVSGKGLAANIKTHYAPTALHTVTALLLFANVLNIAADLGAMAASARLVLPSANTGFLVIGFALASLLLQVFTTYARYAKYLKYLTLTLFSYVIVAFVVRLDWLKVFHDALIPSLSFSSSQILLICAILGTTISPYLFFWQTSQEVEEEILHGQTSVKARREQVSEDAIRKMRTDVWSGMAFSNLIMFFIFIACAGTLYAHGITDIVTADQAAIALRPFGELAFLLFALGIIGSGLLAVPVLAGSAAYAIAESMGWKYGLYRKLKQARAFYGVIIIAMAVGVIANFLHLDPIKGLIYAAVANGVIAPVILYFVVKISADKRLMHEYANSSFISGMGWITIIVMSISGIAAIASLV